VSYTPQQAADQCKALEEAADASPCRLISFELAGRAKEWRRAVRDFCELHDVKKLD
jgi:hypothetical protein